MGLLGQGFNFGSFVSGGGLGSGSWKPVAQADTSHARSDNWSSFSMAWDAELIGNYNNTPWITCVRFPAITIPNAATIQTAVWKGIASDNYAVATVNVRLAMVDLDDPAAPINGGQLQTLEGTLTSYVNWLAIPSWTDQTEYTSPDFASLIQTVVDRPGWASGQAMILMLDDYAGDPSSSNAQRGMYGGYNVTGNREMTLNITWTT